MLWSDLPHFSHVLAGGGWRRLGGLIQENRSSTSFPTSRWPLGSVDRAEG